MNGINTVTDKITAEAEAAAARVIEKAEKQAAALVAEAKQAAAEKAAAVAAKAESDCAEIKRRSVSVTDLDKRKMTLAAKREVIDSVFASVREAVYALSAERYSAFMVKLILAAPAYPDIAFAQADRAASENILATLKKESRTFRTVEYTDKIERGFILGDGAVRINYSLDEILASNRAALEPEIAAGLFPADRSR